MTYKEYRGASFEWKPEAADAAEPVTTAHVIGGSTWIVTASAAKSESPVTMTARVGRYAVIPWWHRLWLWATRQPRPMVWTEIGPCEMQSQYTTGPDGQVCWSGTLKSARHIPGEETDGC